MQLNLISVTRNHVHVLTNVTLLPGAEVRGINMSSTLQMTDELGKLLIAPDKD